MHKKFSIKEALKFGWNATINHIGFFVTALLGTWVVGLFINYLSSSLQRGGAGFLGSIVSLAGILIFILISLAFTKTGLRLTGGQEPSFRDFVPVWPQYWQFVLASVICGVLTFAGFILLVIPGIIALIGLQFYRYYLVEKGMPAVESIKKSWETTRGHRWQLFLLLIANALICFAGLLIFGIGLFVAVPIVTVDMAYVYRKLASGQEVIPGV